MLKSGRKTVAVADTRERLQEASETVQSVTLIAIAGNTGLVWCGGPETSGKASPADQHGFPLDDGGGYAELRMRTYTGIDLRDIWIDAPNADDGVTWEARV